MSDKKNKKNFLGFDREKPLTWVIPILMAGFVLPLIITIILYYAYQQNSCDYKNPTNIDIKLSMGLLLNYYTNQEGIMGSTVIVFYVIGAVLVLTIALVLIMILFGMRY